jgi:hypothetical protein
MKIYTYEAVATINKGVRRGSRPYNLVKIIIIIYCIMDEQTKIILQEEADKIGDIVENKNISPDKKQYLKDLKKCMLDRKRGNRKPVKSAEKEKMLQTVCDNILRKRMNKGGVNHNLSLVKGRQSVVVDKEYEKKQKEKIRRAMLMTKKHSKHLKMPPILEFLEYKGGRRTRKNSRKSRKNKQ